MRSMLQETPRFDFLFDLLASFDRVIRDDSVGKIEAGERFRKPKFAARRRVVYKIKDALSQQIIGAHILARTIAG